VAHRVGEDNEEATRFLDGRAQRSRSERARVQASRIQIRHRQIKVKLLWRSVRPVWSLEVPDPLEGQLHGQFAHMYLPPLSIGPHRSPACEAGIERRQRGRIRAIENHRSQRDGGWSDHWDWTYPACR
jgi:hypothetical protein